MFCCDNNKNKMSCYKGMAVGMIAAFTSMIFFNMYKKMKYRKLQKGIQEFEIKERKTENQEYNENYTNNEELREKIDEFNSRRLTKENDSKNDCI